MERGERINRYMWNRTKSVLAILLSSLFVFAGCSDDCPVCPEPPIESQVVPYISYYDYANFDLICAKKIGDSWGIKIVDSDGSVGLNSSLAVDAKGNAHISYWDDTNDDLKYAVMTGEEWMISTVDDDNIVHGTSIAIDAAGAPHIAYCTNSCTGGPMTGIKYAVKTGGGWSTQYVDCGRGNNVNLHPSIALDALGNPHISYWDNTNNNLKYAVKIEGEWIISIVDANNIVYKTSIALDAGGNPHISYCANTCDGPMTCLKYAVNTGSGWSTHYIESNCGSGQNLFPSIAVDALGNPHIAYYYQRTEDLKYAVKTAAGWITEIVDSGGNVGSYSSLAIDKQDNLHVCYHDASNGDLRYAVKKDGFWIIEAVDRFGDSGRGTSLALDAEGNPHIGYFEAISGDLRYAVKAEGTWSSETVDLWGTTGTCPFIALGSQ